jgi:hypothetical protein
MGRGGQEEILGNDNWCTQFLPRSSSTKNPPKIDLAITNPFLAAIYQELFFFFFFSFFPLPVATYTHGIVVVRYRCGEMVYTVNYPA